MTAKTTKTNPATTERVDAVGLTDAFYSEIWAGSKRADADPFLPTPETYLRVESLVQSTVALLSAVMSRVDHYMEPLRTLEEQREPGRPDHADVGALYQFLNRIESELEDGGRAVTRLRNALESMGSWPDDRVALTEKSEAA